MSEWKERLRALDDLGPDDNVYRRALEGPRRSESPDGPSGPNRLAAGIVAFVVFAAAAIFGWQAFRPNDRPEPVGPQAPPAVITLEGTEEGPTATLSFDGAEQAGVFEGYSWCSTPDDCTSVTRDLGYPPLDDAVEVPAGTPIRFEGDGIVERFVVRTTEGDRSSPNVVVDTDGRDSSVPDEPGEYLIWVAADWDQGSGAFYVRVRATPVPVEAEPLVPSPRTDCPIGIVQLPTVTGSDFVRLASGYVPTWMPEGFGLQAAFASLEDGATAYGVWSDGSCREVALGFDASAHSFEGDVGGSIRPSVGPWMLVSDVPDGCANAVLGEARCLRYVTTTGDGVLTLQMMGLQRTEGDRIALSVFSGTAGSTPPPSSAITVPDVVGLNYLSALGSVDPPFSLLDSEYRDAAGYENGTILEQDPAPGTEVLASEAEIVIHVVVSVAPSERVRGTAWTLSSMDGRGWPVGNAPEVTIEFEDARLQGFSGCNGYSARYRMEGKRLIVGDVTTTLIGCNGDRAWVEERLLTLLRSEPTVTVREDELRLTAAPEGVADFTRM